MTEVNDFLKHGNVADAYEASPSFGELTEAHAVCMSPDGNRFFGETEIADGRVTLSVGSGQALLLTLCRSDGKD